MHLNSALRVSYQFEVSATKLGKLGKPFYAPNYLTAHWLETVLARSEGFQNWNKLVTKSVWRETGLSVWRVARCKPKNDVQKGEYVQFFHFDVATIFLARINFFHIST
jgi:hypothetical protein